MSGVISILFIEESEASNQPLKAKLEKSEFEFIHFSQNSSTHLKVLMNAHKWDLIIADLDNELSDLEEILEIVDEQEFITPLILAGTDIHTNIIYKAMKSGAQDYVDKNNLNRLLPVVAKEIKYLKKQRNYIDITTKNRIFDRILEKSSNEVFLLDPMSLKITYANEILLKNIGYSKEELYRLPVRTTIADYDIRKVYRKVAPIYKGEEKSVTFQFDRKRKNGTTYPVEMHLEVTQQESRQHFMGISFDISQQVEDAAIIEKQRKKTRELELNNEYKSKFFANLSHEMRTILNSSLLLTNVLKDKQSENLYRNQIEYLDAIYQSNNNVLSLLSEVLDLSKIETGNISVRLEKVKIEDIFKKNRRLFQPIAREKGLSFECSLDPLDFDSIYTDPLRLDQVLNNLISNAMKFTEDGFIHLNIFEPTKAERKLAGIKSRRAVGFSVKDTGIGIPEYQQEEVFHSYIQALRQNTESNYGGTGLGLAISREIAHILGGEILLESTPNEGSTFTFYLPIDSSKAVEKQSKNGKIKITDMAVKQKKNKTDKEPKKLNCSVLLIDDSSIHNMALKEYLSYQVSNCVAVESATEAYKQLNSQKFNCIILDMYLPDANGREVIEYLKSKNKYQDIPVIVYSGKNISAKEEAELNRMASTVVQKNANSYKILLERIKEIVD